MADIEIVVRPFQLPSVAPADRYVTPGQPSIQPVRLIVGRSGAGRTFSGSYSSKTEFYLTQQVVEKSS